jgi:hypothetical protein
MKDNLTNKHFGFIAEEIYEKLGKGYSISSDGKTVNYLGLIAPLVKIIQNLMKDNTLIKNEFETVKNEIQLLKEQINMKSLK